MQIHNIKSKNKSRKSRRVARGGKRGGYSGRGIKGQKSRAGAKIRPALRDTMSKFPKQRGRAKHSFKSLFKKPAVLNLSDMEKKFKAGDIVSPAHLFKNKMIKKSSGKFSGVKILGEGKLTKPLHFQNVLLSKSARDKVIKAKGTIR